MKENTPICRSMPPDTFAQQQKMSISLKVCLVSSFLHKLYCICGTLERWQILSRLSNSWGCIFQIQQGIICRALPLALKTLQYSWQHIIWFAVCAFSSSFGTFEDSFFAFSIGRPAADKLMLNSAVNQQGMKVTGCQSLIKKLAVQLVDHECAIVQLQSLFRASTRILGVKDFG